MRTPTRSGWLGSVVLLIAVAVLILRPWEAGENDRGNAGPRFVEAHVTRVVDGDTFEARVGGKIEDVRLIGVDTPETVKPGAPVQCFGPQASNFSKRLLKGRQVRLVLGTERRDTYGRLLAYARLGPPGRPPSSGSRGASFVNAVLLRRGLARSLTIPPNDRFAALFRRLELRAARTGRGLWGNCAP